MTPAGLREAQRRRTRVGQDAGVHRTLLGRATARRGRDDATQRGTAAMTARRRWIALVVLCVGQLMIVLDATVVNVALPSIQHDFHATQTALAWVINAYLITFGGLLMLAGRLGDLLGRRRVFLAGVGMFTIASALCGLAPNEGMLVAARFVQGIGAAIVASMVLGILVTLFADARDTARAMSVYAFVASAGGSIGLLVGGVLTQAVDWHWIFFINVPIGIAAVVLGSIFIPAHRGAGIRGGVDLWGAALITATPSLVVFTILQASTNGWGSVSTVVMGAAALVLGATFVVVESRVAHPLVPLHVFQSRNVVGAVLVRLLFPVGLFGSFFLGALYMQRVLGFSPIATGVAFMPMNLCVALFSLFLTARLVARVGARATLVPGLLLVATGLVLLARAPVAASYVVDVLPALLLMGIGAGLVFMPSVALAMSGVAPGESGLASGVANVALQVGAAVGVAVIAGVSAGRTGSLLAHGATSAAALTGGYHAGYLVAAGCVAVAAIAATLVLRAEPARQASRAAQPAPAMAAD